MNSAVIGVGSNIDPDYHIKIAKEKISAKMRLVNSSSFVKTDPLGFKNQDKFTNGAFLVETELGYTKLKEFLKDIETQLGRVKTDNKDGPRTIDLDIIVWNNEIVDFEVYERDFLKESVTELIPGIEI